MQYDRKEFEIEYGLNHQEIPFANIFDDNPMCKEYLYNDFCNSEPCPNLRLYTRKYFTDEEVKRGIIEAGSKIPSYPHGDDRQLCASIIPLTEFESKFSGIENEFYSLVVKKKLDELYFFPSIIKTKIITVLCKVREIVDDICKEPVRNYQSNIFEYCKRRIDDIISELNKLQFPEIKRGVAESIINNDVNVNISFSEERDVLNERWKSIKIEINHLLRKYIETLNLIDENENESGTNKLKISGEENTNEPQQYCIELDEETKNKVLEIFKFWNIKGRTTNNFKITKNIFKNITQDKFLEMAGKADFSELYNTYGFKHRTGQTVIVLSEIINIDEWTKQALRNLNESCARNLKRNTHFDEYNELKLRFMQ